METAELLKKVRKLEIKARGLSTQQFAGSTTARSRKRYVVQRGARVPVRDDIRSIDWNVTARMNHPYIKVFSEERELNVILLIDISGSGAFGTTHALKRETDYGDCGGDQFFGVEQQRQDRRHLLFGRGGEIHPAEEGQATYFAHHPRFVGV